MADRPRYAADVGWLYFLVKNTSGTVRLIVRRNGPDIQMLTPAGWIDRPELLTRFQDPDYLEEASLVAAKNAANEKGLSWESSL